MKTLLKLSFLLIALWLSGCNQTARTSENSSATIKSEEQTDLPAYDSSMDPYLVEGTERLADTLGIKMYITTMEPGDSIGWHTHPDHSVYVIQGGNLAVYFEGMEKQTMELPDGAAIINPSISDAAVNTGNTTIKLLTHDIYRSR